MENRLGIFVIYNKNGCIERYVIYLLEALKKCCSKVIAVCNGAVLENEKKKLGHCTDLVFIRDNIGYDCGAIKDVLVHLYGWGQVLLYDELVVMNDTCYGPVYPFGQVFEKMGPVDCDFWGLTEQWPMPADVETWGMETLPYHIQSYFVVFRKKLLHGPCFQSFWEGVGLKAGYYETVKNYELRMTNFFLANGFQCAAYVQKENKPDYCYVRYEPYQLLKDYGMPLIKRKAAIFYMEENVPFFSALERKRFLDFLGNGGLYDTDLILEDFRHKYGTSQAEAIQKEKPDIQELKAFREKYGIVLIYGTGAFAQMVTNTFEMENVKFDAYLVSDGYRKGQVKNGKKVYEIADIGNFQKDCIGIVLGLDKKNRNTVLKTLEGNGFHNI